MRCRWCGIFFDDKSYLDTNADGFWCDVCDGFNFYKQAEHQKHRLLLLLEEKSAVVAPCNVSSGLRLRKQLSPLRYPGGKSKLIDYLYSKLSAEQLNTFVEIYAGGASLGLSLLDAGLIKRLILNERDPGVYSFWKTVLERPQELVGRLEGGLPTHYDLAVAKEQIAAQVASEADMAWFYLLANRLSYSGIVSANARGGKTGTQEDLLSRWNPQKLINRILHIHSMRSQIELHNEDGCSLLQNLAYWNDQCTIFIDPPYFEKGPVLYPCSFTERDHIALAEAIQELWSEFPGPDIIITYDNHPKIRELYPLAQQEVIARKYSI